MTKDREVQLFVEQPWFIQLLQESHTSTLYAILQNKQPVASQLTMFITHCSYLFAKQFCSVLRQQSATIKTHVIDNSLHNGRQQLVGDCTVCFSMAIATTRPICFSWTNKYWGEHYNMKVGHRSHRERKLHSSITIVTRQILC